MNVRHLNLLQIHLEKITKADKKMVGNLDYEDIKCLASRKDFAKIEKKNNIWINVLCYENNFVYSVRISDEKFENYMDLLIITNKNKSNYDYIKEFMNLFI